MINKIKQFLATHYAIALITLGALIIRLYKLTAISLWHDEAFSALLIKYSWSEMMYRIGLDVHPPLYYIFLRIWHYVFGHSLFSLRAMSVAFGVGAVVMTYVLVKDIFSSRRAALIAALLVALNPFQIQYVTEARMYTMGAFLALLGAWLLVKALKAQRAEQRHGGYYILFGLASGAMMLTHYYLLFTVAALGIYGLYHLFQAYGPNARKYLWLIASGLIAGLTFLPWLKIFFFQYRQVGAGYWIPAMDIWSVPRTLYDLLFRISEPHKLLMLVTSAIVLWAIWAVVRYYREEEKWLVISGFIAPFVGALLFALLANFQGQSSSVYLVRYFIFASAFLLSIMSMAIKSINSIKWQWAAIWLLSIISLFSVFYYWHQLDTDKRTGMAAAAQYLRANVQPGHKIYVGSSFVFFNYKYYNQTPTTPKLYSGGQQVENMPHFAGTAILTNEELVPDFHNASTPGDTIWLLWTTGFGGSKPAVPNNWTQVSERAYEDIRPYTGSWIIVTEYKVN